MIIDYKNDYDNARLYDIIEIATGKSHPNMDIFYADDETGVVRFYKRDEQAEFYFVDKDGLKVHKDSPFQLYKREGDERAKLPNRHVILPDGTKRYIDDSELETAWEETIESIRIVRKP